MLGVAQRAANRAHTDRRRRAQLVLLVFADFDEDFADVFSGRHESARGDLGRGMKSVYRYSMRKGKGFRKPRRYAS